MYCNEWDVESIIADRAQTKNWPLKKESTGLALVRMYLDAYAKVHPNLVKHEKGYPSPSHLRKVTVAGHNETDDAVNLIIRAVDRDDPRPVWYGNWGSNSGSRSNLRRALDKVKAKRSDEAYRAFAGKLRISTLDGGRGTKEGHNDMIQLHVETGYPTMDGGRWYHQFRRITERAGGFDLKRDIKTGHGALGEIYTTPKEGDSWTFVYLIPTGLSDPSQPHLGGWAGRYGPRANDPLNRNSSLKGKQLYWANQRDTWKGTTHRNNTASRWATHMQNDFKARMDWCVTPKFDDTNHVPLPHCQGDSSRRILRIAATPGQRLALGASGSTDPDDDRLNYHWSVYEEPGTYRSKVTISDHSSQKATLHVPNDADGKTIHVILQVTDDGMPALTRYRRIIVGVPPAGGEPASTESKTGLLHAVHESLLRSPWWRHSQIRNCAFAKLGLLSRGDLHIASRLPLPAILEAFCLDAPASRHCTGYRLPADRFRQATRDCHQRW